MNEITCCWYKRDATANWERGIFHQWSQSHIEFESGPGNFPAAIVQEATNGQCHVVDAGQVSFQPGHPDAEDDNIVWDEAMEVASLKAFEEGRARPLRDFIDELKNTRYTLPNRFEPRLIKIDNWFAVQVHPEVIELFEGYVYACQVRWIDGEIDCTRGGIPADQLRLIFNHA
jgi:hypothetical protein